jgi:transposase InsO family protein
MAAIQLQPPQYEMFDCRSEGKNIRWAKWVRRLENNVFIGCGINNPAQKKGLLLMYAGPDLNDIVDSFEEALLQPVAAVAAAGEQPEVPGQDVYQRLTAAITNHFNPRVNTEFQRYLFKKSVQETPTIDEFYYGLKQLASTCNFAAGQENSEIKSQLIMGCKLDKVRDKGLSDPDATLEQLLQYGRNLELTQAHSKAIKNQSVNAIVQPQRRSHRQQGSNNNQNKSSDQQARSSSTGKPGETESAKRCRYCGGSWHEKGLRTCPAQGKTCKKCKKKNHFASVCLSASNTNVIEEEEEEEPESSESDQDYTFKITTNKGDKSPYFEITVGNNDQIRMMADSGASVNILSENHYKSMAKRLTLQESTAKIFAYGDSKPLEVLGEATTSLRYKNRQCTAKLIVVKKGRISLLSWETSMKLKLMSLVNVVQQTREVDIIIAEYSDLFTGLGKLKDYKVHLHIDESVTPIAQTHRRVPFHMRKDLEKQLEKDEELGVIERSTGPTPWVSPVVCVPKKNGQLRVCIDMRCANMAVKRERHGTPTITELVNDLNGATVFSKLDLNQGYNQLELDESSRYITTFATHVGLRRFKRLNFGICSAAEVFQEAIRQALAGLSGVINLSDDILVYGSTQAEHNKHLKATLQRLREKGLTLSREKCEFNKRSISFFGHIFSEKGLAPDPAKISSILQMEPPKSASEVRSLLGMTNYCGSRFIHKYATLTQPLRELTTKSAVWEWTTAHQTAYDSLKIALAQAPVLKYFNPSLETELYVDASPVGLCAILMQVARDGIRHTVQYASRALTPVEQRYSQTEREALAVVWSCEQLHLYVMGSSFKIYTDHKPLLPLFNDPKSKPPARIERWTLRLQPYEFKLLYRNGKDNPADYLSRHTPASNLMSNGNQSTEAYINYVTETSIPKSMTVAEIKTNTKRDVTLQTIIEAVQTGRWDKAMNRENINRSTITSFYKIREELSVVESGDLLLRGTRIVIPSQLQQQVVELAHAGHQGMVKTKALIREKVWFAGINELVEKTIRSCMACQVATPTTTREPLRMSPLPQRPWSELSTDFGQVPGLNTHFMVISDDYSRYVVVEQVPSLTSKAVIPVLDKVISEFGIPSIIKSDNGPPFNSDAFAKFAKHKGFKHRKITPLWPLANGEAERFMRTIKKTMKAAISQGRSWNQDLNSFLLNYRATPHSSTKVAPATLLFGRNIQTTLPSMSLESHERTIIANDREAKSKMKTYADRKAWVKDANFKIGDPVLLKREGVQRSDPPFNPKPLTVTAQKGSMITAHRNGKEVTRNSSHFKPSPNTPNESPSSDEEEEDIPHIEPATEPATEPTTEPVNQPQIDRPHRIRKLPTRFNDFIMSSSNKKPN